MLSIPALAFKSGGKGLVVGSHYDHYYCRDDIRDDDDNDNDDDDDNDDNC